MIIIKAVKACCLTLLASLFYLTSFAQPTANFSAAPTSGCAPLVVNFIDQSTGSPTHWRWDLGNGTFSNLQNPSVTYFTPGQYNIKLVVQNASGRDSMVRNQYITIYAQPTVFFTASTTTGCFPLTVSFTDQSTPGSGTIQTWQWDFGDGTLSNLPNPTHTYTSAGLFNVSLRITNSNGCTKTLTRPQYINIIGKPRTQFTAPVTTACHAPLTVSFQNQTTGGGTISYQWNFGDGGSSTQTNPMYTYSANGTYTVTLIATNQNGCRDTLVRTNAVVIGNMQTRFNAPDSACVNSDVTFTNTSTPAPASVMWYFGDGTTSVANNPIKSYSTAGIYMVKLVAQYGTCTDSTTKPITILDRPTVDFSGNPLTACMAPLTVNFSNNSSGAVSYSWDFGNGITSTQPNPSYTYNNMGNYTVTLTAN
ncbi:MAG TPA: PKD domain-containing protein, partial [Ferruginibacter sp.]|nr:PKD domain-containing protein [Ferruginibacter sp.]